MNRISEDSQPAVRNAAGESAQLLELFDVERLTETAARFQRIAVFAMRGRVIGRRHGLHLADILLMPRGAVDERARDEEEPQAPRMVEVIVEPAESVAVFVAMHRHREVVGVARLEHDLSYGELHYVDDSPWVLPRLQKRADALDIARPALPD